MDLRGKVAFVSGGTRGIGRAVVEKLAEKGADVVLSYFRSRQDATETKQSVECHGVRCETCRVNMANLEQVPTIFERIRETFGRLDILVSNAALGTFTDMLNIDRKSWELSMHTNARAFLICLQLGTPLMSEGSRIVALSSLGSTRYIPGYAAIGVSKAAIENMVRYSAIELAPKGITVNCVSGGFIDTGALKMFPNYQTLLDEVIERTPFKRMGRPEEVADVVLFLAGPNSGWITGQTIVVDGGYSLM